MANEEKICIKTDPEFAPLIPGYLLNRLNDAAKIDAAALSGDFETARRLGHCMKGSGSGYGFDGITEIGRDIELAAKAQDNAAIKAQTARLKDYLARLEIIYD